MLQECAKLKESGGSEILSGIKEDPGVPVESSRALAPGWPIRPIFCCIDSKCMNTRWTAQRRKLLVALEASALSIKILGVERIGAWDVLRVYVPLQT